MITNNNYSINIKFLNNSYNELEKNISTLKKEKDKYCKNKIIINKKIIDNNIEICNLIFNHYYYRKLLNVLNFNKIIIEQIINI